MSDKTATGTAQDLVITRAFAAPRELVWRAWSEPEHFKAWFGPKGYTIPSCDIDFRVGGRLLFAMRGPDGQDIWCTGTYLEIEPMERIVFSDSFADEQGNIVPASHYGMNGDIPLEMMVTVTFEEAAGKTIMTMRHAGLPTPDAEGANEGWSQSFNKLAAHLAEAA
jgi:uncharacterized protein YndB with AHSA1/START domain